MGILNNYTQQYGHVIVKYINYLSSDKIIPFSMPNNALGKRKEAFN